MGIPVTIDYYGHSHRSTFHSTAHGSYIVGKFLIFNLPTMYDPGSWSCRWLINYCGHTHASTTSFFSSRSVSSCPFQESVDGSQAVALSLSCGHSLFLRSHQSSGRLTAVIKGIET